MYDRFNRKINYLRISVTDRCNLRCSYCMPEEGITLFSHKDIITFEEIINVVHVAVRLGIDKIRLTGGEPLVRKGILNLVQMIAATEGVKDLGLTTNGILLETYAEPLASAGLKRINISLDTLDPKKYRLITRGGDIARVMAGIEAARRAGLSPVKINCVVKENSGEKDALEVRRFSEENGLEVRFIHQMNLAGGVFSVVEGGSGGDCTTCNRLRLTSNALLKPCLFSDSAFSIREHGIKKAFELALNSKPEKGTHNHSNCFNNIGG